MKKLLLVGIAAISVLYIFAQDTRKKLTKGQYPKSVDFSPGQAPGFIKGKVVFINDSGNYEFSNGRLLNIEPDTGKGRIHVRTQQLINNILVENAVYMQHVVNDKVLRSNGMWLKNIPARLATKPTVSKTSALATALKSVGAISYKWQVPAEEALLKQELHDAAATYYPQATLVYYSGEQDVDSALLRLAFKFDLYAHTPLSRQLIFIDAINGQVLGKRNLIYRADVPATALTAYSGTQQIITDGVYGNYRLRETTRGQGIETYNLMGTTSYGTATDFLNSTTTWNNINDNKDQYATDAHWGSEKTWDYFYYNFGRNSIDNAGFALKSYLHYSSNYNNAFWDGLRLSYGDGNGVNNFQPLTTLDICGHEISHGLTQYTSNLVYSGESGALNEGYSDIFGTAIEKYARPSKWDWIIAGDIAGFRNMSNPNAYAQPDTYKGQFWDYAGEVHINSGVLNYWFYLLSTGGSGVNDIYCNYNVQGIGVEKAAAIAYKTNTQYLFPTATYEDAAKYSMSAAAELFGIASNEYIQTAAAWSAVGLNIPSAVPSVMASASSICAGGTTKLFIRSGNLNSANYWQWYYGKCGGDIAGTGLYLDVSPDSTTTYYVRGEGGCVSFGDCGSVTVTVYPKPAKPAIELSGPANFCEGQQVTLKANDGFASYTWNNGSSGQSVSISKSGNYTVKGFTADGCQSQVSDPVTITVAASALKPVITVSGSTSNCTYGNVKLSSSTAAGYQWSTGETTQTVSITKPGDYFVTTTTAGGCSATSLLQTVRFTDNQPPVPEVTTLPDITGECALVVSTIPLATDACVGMIKATTKDPLTYNKQGKYTITWSYDDGNGNISSQQQRVSITDQTKPLVVCPNITAQCASINGIYNLPPATATDNCGIDNAGFTYTISGATTRSGTGTDASGFFATGISTLTFTARDINGNTGSSSTTVVISNSINATISDVYAVATGGEANTLYIGYGPTSLTLTPAVTGGTGSYTYLWSTGYSGKTLIVTTAIAGLYVYNVIITDSKGCSVKIYKTIKVVDVRCGNKNDKVAVCHIPPGNAANMNTNCVSGNSVDAQLAKDSKLGSCDLQAAYSRLGIIAPAATSARSDEEALSVILWPNPSSDNFKIIAKSKSDQPIALDISDVLGRVVVSKINIARDNIIVLGNKLSPGNYFIRLRQQGNQAVIKAIKVSK